MSSTSKVHKHTDDLVLFLLPGWSGFSNCEHYVLFFLMLTGSLYWFYRGFSGFCGSTSCPHRRDESWVWVTDDTQIFTLLLLMTSLMCIIKIWKYIFCRGLSIVNYVCAHNWLFCVNGYFLRQYDNVLLSCQFWNSDTKGEFWDRLYRTFKLRFSQVWMYWSSD